MKRFSIMLSLLIFLLSTSCATGACHNYLGQETSTSTIHYLSPEQIVSRLAVKGAAVKKTNDVSPYKIGVDYESYTDGVYQYFIDPQRHAVRIIIHEGDIKESGASLSSADINARAASLFRLAYGYELIGKIEVINHGIIGDEDSRMTIDVVETINDIETGNKGLIFLYADGALSKAIFFPGTKTAESIASEMGLMISEDKAKTIALNAVKVAVKEKFGAQDATMINTPDNKYSAKIQTNDDKSNWTIEFKARFITNSGKEMVEFFGVQIDVFTGEVIQIYSSVG
jgi:hypothetical protein